ncbi:MAG: Hsp20/alpha crystallin family protein [Candidatus Aenigmarchaeota archaeon]|nr:Hsp20/alpha crystallin family protein [Candidatus Aenigmarchaeota archaeon]
MERKKRDFRYYWEEPVEKKSKTGKPLEISFTFPQMQLPVMKVQIIPMDVRETDKAIVVRAEIHGFEKDEIILNVTHSTIEINASKKGEKVEHGKRHYKRESSFNSVQRSFMLPGIIDPNATRAKLENGLLTVVMPKAEAKKKKKIDVK